MRHNKAPIIIFNHHGHHQPQFLPPHLQPTSNTLITLAVYSHLQTLSLRWQLSATSNVSFAIHLRVSSTLVCRSNNLPYAAWLYSRSCWPIATAPLTCIVQLGDPLSADCSDYLTACHIISTFAVYPLYLQHSSTLGRSALF